MTYLWELLFAKHGLLVEETIKKKQSVCSMTCHEHKTGETQVTDDETG